MVDNVAITPGTGATVAADDVGGVLHQRVKTTWGPDGTANDADVASGKPLPVQLRGSDGTDRSNSLPVTIASAGVASGAIASGAVASGAFASGALASGAVSSGAFASGALASGSIAAGAIAAGATSIAENEDVASADGDRGVKVLFKRVDAPANSSGTDGDYEQPQMSAGALWVHDIGGTYTGGVIDVTRPANTTAYTANDVWSDSTSAPTSGGYTITSAARKSGGSGILTDMFITSSAVPGTLLQGEIHIFNQAATNVNDNSAWALSDSEAKTRVGVVAFTLLADANNSYYHATNLNYGFTCVGTANLRYLIKVKNAYTPASGEVLSILPKIIYVD